MLINKLFTRWQQKMNHPTTLVFVDVKNMLDQLQTHLPEYVPQVTEQLASFMDELGAEYGEGTQVRVYADFTAFPQLNQKVADPISQIIPVDTASINAKGETLAAALIALDLQTLPSQQMTIAIAAGNRFMTPALMAAQKALDLEVEIIDFGATSYLLKKCADAVVCGLELIDDTLEIDETATPTESQFESPAAAVPASTVNAKTLLMESIKKANNHLPLATASHLLKQYQRAPKNWQGYHNFKSFVQSLGIPNLEVLPEKAGVLTIRLNS